MMADAMNFLQYSLNGLQSTLTLIIVLGLTLAIAGGMIELFRRF